MNYQTELQKSVDSLSSARALRTIDADPYWPKAEKTHSSLPEGAIAKAVSFLNQEFPNGLVKLGRRSFEGSGTILPSSAAVWTRGHRATYFPLLEKVSVPGEVSPFLSDQWSETKARIERLVNV